MTTPLFFLRCMQLEISIRNFDLLSIGLLNDTYMYTEAGTMGTSTENELTNRILTSFNRYIAKYEVIC